MYLWLYCELLSFIFHRQIGSQELYEMSGGAIWHKNPILSACLCETPATYSQSLSGWFNTVSDAFAFFYTIYANTKWPEGWPTDQIPKLKISKMKVFYFGRETIPESSQIPMRLLRIWYWWHSSYHFFLQKPWTELLYDYGDKYRVSNIQEWRNWGDWQPQVWSMAPTSMTFLISF